MVQIQHPLTRRRFLRLLSVTGGSVLLAACGGTPAAQPNTWVHMPTRLPHSIRAETPVKMLLLLLKGQGVA